MAWVEAGQNPDSFWSKTPREVHLILEACKAAEIRRHNQMVWAVWHIAALSRLKRLPKLKSLFYKEPKPRQSWQTQMAIMGQWAERLKEKATK